MGPQLGRYIADSLIEGDGHHLHDSPHDLFEWMPKALIGQDSQEEVRHESAFRDACCTSSEDSPRSTHWDN